MIFVRRIFKAKKAEFKKNIYIFGIRIYSKFKKLKQSSFDSNSNKIILYFDHSLGGGTEVYSKAKINQLVEENVVLQIQPLKRRSLKHCFRLTLHKKEKTQSYFYENLEEVIKKLGSNVTIEVVVNNLVGYVNLPQILCLIKQLKKAENVKKVTAKAHDYFTICPGINLLDSTGNFCDLPDKKTCDKCYSTSKYINREFTCNIQTFDRWTELWEEFYQDVVDEVIVFSDSSKTFFTKAYPILENKISVVPHKVEPFEYLQNQGNDKPYMVIGLLGVLCFHKGSEIVAQMQKIIEQNGLNVKIVLIGKNLDDKTKNIYATGSYKREELPEITTSLNIDLIFISSIWPETFSYTTSEAIFMDLPIACFNLGAQAEKVSKYQNGLVISEISPEIALEEIVNFLKDKKKILV